MTRALLRLLYVDDDVRLNRWREWLSKETPPAANENDPLQLMLFACLGFVRRPVAELDAAWSELWSASDLRHEILDMLELLADRQRRPTFETSDLALRVHATYSLRRDQRRPPPATRREADALAGRRLLLRRRESGFYDDRVIAPRLFQWESQSRTRAASRTGQRYQRHAAMNWRIFLFVRRRAEDDRGFTSPYLFLGPARYVSHESEKPMRIVWGLERAVPPEFFSDVKIAAG